MTLYLQNEGEIDLAAITTFGVSVKETKNPIGFFGTGLKFAIAITARLGGRVVLYRGLQRYDFQPRKLEVRGQSFNSLSMVPDTGQATDLPFTTELGKLWEPWQGFRELYCNGLDEPGFTHGTERIRPRAGFTTLEIIDCPTLEAAYRERADYILEGQPVSSTKSAEIHAMRGKGIYYRGVLVREEEALYGYNVLAQLTLTEDRTLKDGSSAYSTIATAIRRCTDSTICTRIVAKMCEQGASGVERSAMGYMWEGDPTSPAFANACVAAYRKMGDRCPERIRKIAKEAQPEQFGPKQLQLGAFDRRALERATAFLQAIGHPIDYEVVCVDSLGEGVLGQAKDNKIWISRICLDKGTKIIAGTMLEESLHLSMGFHDCSRDFQDYLLDRYITLAERHVFGEPL